MELAGAARHRELVEVDLAEVVEGHSDLVLLGTLVGWRHGVVITAWCVRAATATKPARATCADGWRVGASDETLPAQTCCASLAGAQSERLHEDLHGRWHRRLTLPTGSC